MINGQKSSSANTGRDSPLYPGRVATTAPRSRDPGGVVKINPLSSTISNMVVDTVIRHWATVVDWEDLGTEGFGRAVGNLAALFYTDDIILAYLRLSRLQEALDVLTGLFGRVGLRYNVYNMVNMVCQLCRTAVSKFEEEYTTHITGERLTYWER